MLKEIDNLLHAMSSMLFFAGYAGLVLLLLPPTTTCGAKPKHHDCHSSFGKISDIRYPFRFNDDRPGCGDSKYELGCESNRTILHLSSGKYYVEEIHYHKGTIRVVDTGLQKGDCSSLPLHSLTPANFSFRDPYHFSYWTMEYVNFIDCEDPINSSLYIDIAPCSRKTSNISSVRTYSYVVVGDITLSDLANSCGVGLVVPISTDHGKMMSYLLDIHDRLLYGTYLRWCNCFDYLCTPCGLLDLMDKVQWIAGATDEVGEPIIVLAVAARIFFGVPCLLIFLIYKWRRRNLSMYCAIEEFIQTHNSLRPIRYPYKHIKKMTKGFKEKLGQGGYGSVYKGKLKSGHLVAIKIMASSKSNGQDFINEVATIGRIHHFNVVRLIGFCVEGSKRALVYDFMPNGSLDKYIFPEKQGYISLSFQKMYQICLGVAHGIEYLHQGCDMQILHFDIKPHNILLDKNFTPKVSDFGLAKSYPADSSNVSLTGARGTRGYMAPELFYKNIGGVSYKADVFSFGMLLMEMAGRRKNLNLSADHSSQIYFPSWAYDQFSEGKKIEIADATEEEQELAKKMVLVALWCIQLKPSDRPSMHQVIEMLEGHIDLLQLPPKPSLTHEDSGKKTNTKELSITITN